MKALLLLVANQRDTVGTHCGFNPCSGYLYLVILRRYLPLSRKVVGKTNGMG